MKKFIAVMLCFVVTASMFGCGRKVESIEVTASQELELGTEEQIEVIILPEEASDKTLTYTSSKPEVATVDEAGKIATLSAGETEIKVQSSNEEVSYSYTLTVAIPVETVSFKESEIIVPVGGTVIADTEILPSDATNTELTYASSDETIASVAEDGTITGVSKGTSTITATSTNGKEATINVTVQTPVESIAIEQQGTSVAMDEIIELTVLYTPEDAEYGKAITWSTSDANIAIVDESGKATGVNIGKATITATTEAGLTATTELSVTKKATATKTGQANTNNNTKSGSTKNGNTTNNTRPSNNATNGGTTNNSGGATNGGSTNGNGGATNGGGTTPNGGGSAQVSLNTTEAINSGISYANTLPYVKGVGSTKQSYNFGIVVSMETSQAELNSRVRQQVDMAYATIMSGVNKSLANGASPEDIPISEIGIWFDGNAINVGW